MYSTAWSDEAIEETSSLNYPTVRSPYCNHQYLAFPSVGMKRVEQMQVKVRVTNGEIVLNLAYKGAADRSATRLGYAGQRPI